MTKFVIDEDMPRSTAGCLRDSGYEVMDIRDRLKTDYDIK